MYTNTCRNILRVCWSSVTNWSETTLCISAVWGGDSAESCRRPRLCPSSPFGSVPKPFSVLWKAGWPVRNLHKPSTLLFFVPSSYSDYVILFPRLPLGNLSNINIDTNTLEFQVHRNQVSAARLTFTIIQGFRQSDNCTAGHSPLVHGRGRQHVEAVCLWKALCVFGRHR